MDIRRVEERVVPVLELDTEMKRKAVSDLLECTNNAQSMFDMTHMVVRHFKDEERCWDRIEHISFSVRVGSGSVLP